MHSVYYHPACYTSYRLLRLLKEDNLLGKVNIINVERMPHLSVTKRVLTVPLIFRDESPIYGGPIDINVAKEVVLGKTPKLSVNDVQGAVIAGAADSAAVSSLILASGSLAPLAELPEFIAETTGLYFDDEKERKLREAIEIVSNDDGRLYEESKHKFMATLVFNKAREDLYLGIDRKSPDDFLSWLVAKVSLGRAGVPFTGNVSAYREMAEEMHRYYVERKEKIAERLQKEKSEIEEFMRSFSFPTSQAQP